MDAASRSTMKISPVNMQSVFDAPVAASSPLATTPADKILLRTLVDQLAAVPGGKGLDAVVSALRGHGLGTQAESWIRSKPNVDVSGAELRAALKDEGPLNEGWATQAAQACNLEVDQVFDHLASLLPAFIERLTPRGELPSEPVVAASLDSIRRQLGSAR